MTFVDGVESTEDLVETVRVEPRFMEARADPVRDGFTFEGFGSWTRPRRRLLGGVTRDMTLYAKWAQAPCLRCGTTRLFWNRASPLAKTEGGAGMTIVLALGFVVVSAATVGFFARRRVR